MEKKKEKTEEKSLLKKAERLRNKAPVKNTTTNPHPILAKVALRIATIITLTFVAAFALMIILPNLKKTFFTPKKELHEAMVTQQLLSVQELITQKYRYSDIITLKKSIMFSKSYSIVKFTGIIRAGISDVSKIKFKIIDSYNGSKSIRLKLPKSEILGNDIVEQAVFDEKRSLFVPITTQEIFDEIDLVRNNIAEEIVGEGFLSDADSSAKKTITQMMYALGFEAVEVSIE